MVQGEDRLDQPGDARGGLQVPEIRLHGAQQQRLVGVAARTQHGTQGARLDRVAERRAGAVRLDVVDVRRGQPRPCAGGRQQGLLGGRVGGQEAVGAAVGVDGGGADDGEDAVAVALGVGQPLQQHGRTALTASDAVGVRRERLAPPVRREGTRAPERHGDGGGEQQVDARRDRRVALARAQAHAGMVHGDQ